MASGAEFEASWAASWLDCRLSTSLVILATLWLSASCWLPTSGLVTMCPYQHHLGPRGWSFFLAFAFSSSSCQRCYYHLHGCYMASGAEFEASWAASWLDSRLSTSLVILATLWLAPSCLLPTSKLVMMAHFKRSWLRLVPCCILVSNYEYFPYWHSNRYEDGGTTGLCS